jgi:hypothetical protein
MSDIAANQAPGPSEVAVNFEQETGGSTPTAAAATTSAIASLEGLNKRDIIALFSQQFQQTQQLLEAFRAERAEVTTLRARLDNPSSTSTPSTTGKQETDLDKYMLVKHLLSYWPTALNDIAPNLDPDAAAVPHVLDHQMSLLDAVTRKLHAEGHYARKNEYNCVTSIFAFSKASFSAFIAAVRALIPPELYDDALLKIENTVNASLELAAIRATLIQCATLNDDYDKNFVAYIEAKLTDPSNANRMVSSEMAKSYLKYQSEFQNKLLTVITKEGAKLHKLSSDNPSSSHHSAGPKSDKKRGKKKVADAPPPGGA